jgi:hypothetical protein
MKGEGIRMKKTALGHETLSSWIEWDLGKVSSSYLLPPPSSQE